jgi:uncharacterized protein
MPTGPVALRAAARARLQPLPGGPFVLEGGFWGDRQRLVSECSLPHAWAALEQTGRLANASPASLAGEQPYSGDTYADSDVYKTLEALVWEHSRQPSAAVHRLLVETAAGLAAAQAPDGYLHSWFQRPDSPGRYTDLQMGHELYCAGHLLQAAIAERRTGADFGLMPIAVRLADHLVERFGDPALPYLCGHPLIEMALVELFRTTGTTDYLDLAARMIDGRGYGTLGPGLFGAQYYQDSQPVRAAESPAGHCVRALYLACGATDVYLETGDRTLLDAMVTQWDSLVANKTYLTGGVGCRRKDESFGAPFELPPDHAFAETCAGVALFMWGWRMLLATGHGRYADLMELLLFNLLPAGLSESGTEFSYVNTLHRRRDNPEFGDKRPRRQGWFRCPCCPPNLMRLVGSLGFYLATQDDGGVQLHQYVSGRFEAAVRGGTAALEVHTGYPHGDEVLVTVLDGPTSDWTLSLRVPAWCGQVTLTVAGQLWPMAPDGEGYLRVRRRWEAGTEVSLRLAMPARLTYPDARIDGVRGCVAVERGPVVFCLEQDDLDEVPLESVALDPAAPLEGTFGPVPSVHATGVATAAPRHGWPYLPAVSAVVAGASLQLSLKPYYAWGNRGDAAMRVWLPLCTARAAER